MSSELRVLLISGSAPPTKCGVGDYTACLARELSTLDGVAVGLLTSRQQASGEQERELGSVELLKPFDHWFLKEFFVARSVINRWRPDVLHLQWPAAGYDGDLYTLVTQWFRRLVRKPVVLTLHEHIPSAMRMALIMAQAANVFISVRPNFPDGFQLGMSSTVACKPFYFVPSASTLPCVTPTPEQVAAVRRKLGVADGRRIVAYFGLLYPTRGVEQLFRIADPAEHHIVIVGSPLQESDDYYRHLVALVESGSWMGRATLAGYLPKEDAALVLASADAIVLPFLLGGGIWNTSIHAARLQGTTVIATSRSERGYNHDHNVYYAEPGNVEEMSHALRRHIGSRREGSSRDLPRWPHIAAQHKDIYEAVLGR